MAKAFRDLPEPVKKLLAEQLNTAIKLHEVAGVSVLEARQMVLDSGGHQELMDCIANLTQEDVDGCR